MAKYLLLGDLHFSDQPPGSCTASYTDDLFDLLKETVKIADQYSVDAVIQAGDLLHLKGPSRTSHGLTQRIIAAFLEYRRPLFICPGNHDYHTGARFESVFETQPLGVILRSGVAHLLSGWADQPSWLGVSLSWLPDPPALQAPIYGIPWLQDWNAEQAVADKAVERATLELKDGASVPTLVVTHAPFYPPGFELPYENYLTERFATYLPEKASVHYGHVHDRHGTYTAGGKNFCNMGALSRGSLQEHNLTRKVAVAVWDSGTGLFEEVEVPHKPASEVFKLQEAQTKKKTQLDLDKFLTSIGQATIEVTSVEAVLAHVRTLDLSPEVFSLVEELLQGAA